MRDDYDGTVSGPSNRAAEDRETLPKNVRPTHYDLSLWPHPVTLKLIGVVVIHLDILKDTERITLNCVDLDVRLANITTDAKQYNELPRTYDEDKQQVTISLQDVLLPAGSKARLMIGFHGKVRDGAPSGCFRSSWRDPNDQTRHIVSTHFEPVDARSCFPCFDEPALKATFTLKVWSRRGLTCLGNMPVADVKPIGISLQTVTFEKSPQMSTYLLCFVVGEFNVIETDLFSTRVRLYATPNHDIESGRFAMELGARTLAFFEERLGVPFPLPKTDLVAVPGYRGAMEHWGLVTFREDGLLFVERSGSIFQKQVIANVVQHELAHQWFGNLVTMEFWDGLWLNEGFATWAAMYANDAFFPEWKVRQQFLANDLKQALDLDSLRSSHPVEVPVKDAAEIGQIFDAISYSKGSSLLRMLASFIGEDVFLQGVRVYLARHQYGNTVTTQLWDAMSEVSGIDVESVMKAWTTRTGHPVVSVLESENGYMKLKQNRFLRTGDVRDGHETMIFQIPIHLQTRDGVVHKLIFGTCEHVSKHIRYEDLIKINTGHVGFYRTSYAPAKLQELSDTRGQLSAEDRAGLVSDATALAAAGHQSSHGLLSLIDKYSDETELVPWKAVIDALDSIRATWLFQNGLEQQGLRLFQLHLIHKHLRGETFPTHESDGALTRQLQALLFSGLISAEDEDLMQTARRSLRRFQRGDETAIPPIFRPAVFRAALTWTGGDHEAYDFIWRLYRTSPDADLRRVALASLGATRLQPWIDISLRRMLGADVPVAKMYLPLAQLTKHEGGIRAAWRWLRDSWVEIRQKVGVGYEMGRIVRLCVGGNGEEAVVREIEEFFRDRDTEAFRWGLQQGLDEARVKAQWVARGRGEVARWLREKGFLQ